MTEREICQSLYRYFANYEYKLNNTFVFNWESDFFAMSKSGYYVECEIKVTRSDFFVDFKKEKHRLFQDVIAKKTHHVIRNGVRNWAVDDRNFICEVKWHQLLTEWGPFGQDRNSSMRSTRGWSEHGWRPGQKKGKPGYWANDFGDVRLETHVKRLRAQFTDIRIRPIEEVLTPHQFYYAMPAGLVKLEELPKYAGLLEVDAHGSVTCVRRAPYMHKRGMDLTSILLKKYYNLWRYKVPYETKRAIIEHYSE